MDDSEQGNAMMKGLRLGLLMLCMGMLGGCQFMTPLSAPKQDQTVEVRCEGVETCHFLRVNQFPIFDVERQRLSAQARQSGWVHWLEPWWKAKKTMYLTLPAGQHELVTYANPASPLKAQTFHLIHHFEAGQVYTLQFYRQMRQAEAASLLAVAAPAPWCVAVKQAEQVIRRFCRQADVVTGFGEFKELKH